MKKAKKTKEILRGIYKNKYFFPITFLSIFLILRSCYRSSREDLISIIRSDMGFGKAQLMEKIPMRFKSGNYFKWDVYIGNSVTRESGKYYACEEEVLYKWVPVVYYKKNLYSFKILDSPAKFSDFGIPFPDSLNWMYNCRTN